MMIHINATAFTQTHKTDGTVNLEIKTVKEKVFEMMDEINPGTLAEYLAQRMKPEQYAGARLVNILTEEGGGQ